MEYPIHPDGGIIYDPLYREAVKTGQLARYANAPQQDGSLQLGPYRLRFSMSKEAAGYDVIPITYELSWEGDAQDRPATFPVAVEATAFEDESRRQGRDLFDLNLPGHIDLKVEFLGSITGHLKPGGRHILKPDHSDTPAVYPPYERRPFVRSGVIEAGDIVWYKFRYTNTGNTILDPEGYGGSLFFPQIFRRNSRGNYEFFAEPYNLYFRDLEYLYPGESREIWFHLQSKAKESKTPQHFGISPGQYRFKFQLRYRCYRDDAPFLNVWDGPYAYIWEMPFTVEKKPREAPVREGEKTFPIEPQPDSLTRFIRTFEEFMSAFDCHQAPPSDGGRTIRNTLHLQVAPWTRQVVVKLVTAEPLAIKTVAIPIAVNNESLKVAFNPHSRACYVDQGLAWPVIAGQSMADMRTNVQIGPFPELHIRERLKEMMDCGINMVSMTAMPWLYDYTLPLIQGDIHETHTNYQGDAMKYFLDLARAEGMWVEGWGTYPYDRDTCEAISAWITGQPVKMERVNVFGYPAISAADPLLPWANAVTWLYQFQRWGDLYLQYVDGSVPISVEDTRGWVRQDISIRHAMGERTIGQFREWLKNKYTTIEAVNRAWGTHLADFKDIDPEKDQTQQSHGGVIYKQFTHTFYDWNKAVLDLDIFRTEQRVKNYRDTLEIVRKEIPDAVICLRTEGANVLVNNIDLTDPNPHFRHIYYSQRRCAVMADILQKSGIIKYHSDYTTIPYTPSELRQLVRDGVKQGIIPVYLPQFDNMRDIAINAGHGTDYQVDYNLPEPKKGYMMHVLTAVYPWFKAVYEEGGAPGILWEDIQCDGFATETQKREMRLFAGQLKEAISTPAALEARKVSRPPSQDWRKNSLAKPSYVLEK